MGRSASVWTEIIPLPLLKSLCFLGDNVELVVFMVLSSSCLKIVVFSSPASSTTVAHKDGLLLRLLLQTVAMVFSFSRWKMEDIREQCILTKKEPAGELITKEDFLIVQTLI